MSRPQQRRSERLAARVPVRWRRGSFDVTCETGDVSNEGLFLRTEETTFPGALMQVEVDLPDGALRMFVTAAFVGQTISGRGIGAQIFVISSADRRRWRRFYQALAAERNAPPQVVS